VDASLNPVPVAQALSPASVFAGGSSLTLAVTGTSFTATSVVRWNGASRPTTFVSASELRAAITASDVATPGTAQVTVFTGAPGGGVSTPLTFTIRTRPALAVSQTSVAGGASVTATLTNGPGGWADWIALAQVGAPLTSYLQYTFVGNGVTTRTWTVAMPSTAGSYEFRLFADNGYTLLATSPTVTVAGGGGGGGGGPAQLLVSSTTATGGSMVTVTLNDGPGGSTDWIALAATTAANTSYIQYTYVGSGVTNRTWTVAMPFTAGTYEFRLFLNNGYTRAATSPTVTVTEAPAPVLSVSTTTAAPGTPVTVTLTNGRGGSSDWIALARTGTGNTSYVQYVYVGAGKTTFTWTVAAPAAAGAYEFRLFLNNGYTRAATSPAFTVP
jgi:hypothetical protein